MPRGPLGKRPGDWWRRWTWKKSAVLAGSAFVFFMIAMYGSYQYMSSSAAIPTALASATYQNTTVYYSDGKTLLGTFGQFDRQNLTYQQIPMSLQNAVVAAEDKGYWTEGGISPTGIMRAAIHDVTSGGNDLNGGSTITQEFVRNYYDGVGLQQTASRKIKEIFIAQKVAGQYSKQWIMTNYLNTIPMGQGALGVAAAAQTYFGVPASQLTVSQDAVLAGLIQAPSTYSQPSNRSLLQGRWQYVLGQMVKDNYITQAQASAAKFPTMLTDQTGAAGAGIKSSSSDPWAPYLMTQIENELTGIDGVSQAELETGGLKVVTTISRPMEVEMYKAVQSNLSKSSLESASGSQVTSLPSWALVGAELQDSRTGQIIAEYPGKGQSGMTAAQCLAADCDVNTAAYAREQVGSSFKPYVLATAVSQGMNVKTSLLNANPYLCIPPDSTQASRMTLSTTKGIKLNPGSTTTPVSCPGMAGYAGVENDGGEVIGNAKQGGGTTVQNALAQSSNTAFSDLAHRAGTPNIATMAQDLGVNMAPYASGGSGLTSYEGEVGMALGIAPLTVQEQTTMLSTIANNGMYHQAHLIKYWQQGSDGAQQMPKVDQHMVLTPNLDADVQYAMEQTTINGTAAATVTFGQQTVGTVIGKTGTTTDSKSGFFIGATSQYSLAVGMFTKNPKASDSLAELGGGGFGGFWPAKIWNTIAQDKFSTTSTTFPTNPQFYGTAWNQIGKLPPKQNCFTNFQGQKIPVAGQGCPTPDPNQPFCTLGKHGKVNCSNVGPNPNNPNQTCQFQGDPTCAPGQNPNPTATCQFQGDPTCAPGQNPTPTATATCQFQGDPTCAQGQQPGCSFDPNTGQYDICNGTAAPNTNGATNGAGATPLVTQSVGGGALLVLPGSLLPAAWRRRKRANRTRKAE